MRPKGSVPEITLEALEEFNKYWRFVTEHTIFPDLTKRGRKYAREIFLSGYYSAMRTQFTKVLNKELSEVDRTLDELKATREKAERINKKRRKI